MIDALSNSTYTAYDAEGRVLATWGGTYPVAYDYDDFGRMTAMYTYRGTNSLSSYSDISNLKSEMDRTTWLYELATGLLTNKVYADGQGPAYTYTADGKLATRTWARGIVTTYSYDGAGQLTNINYSDDTPDVAFAFDRLGRQTTITDAQGTRAFTYNDTLQLAAETNAMGAITRNYDSLGRSAGFSLGEPYSVRYGYDSMGRFSSVTSTNNQSPITNILFCSYSYLTGSDILSGWEIFSGGTTSVSSTRTYEPNRNLIVQVLNSSGTNLISRYDYVNDAIGRRTQRIDSTAVMESSSLTIDFNYNTRSELIEALMGTNSHSYRYDPIGNRRTATNNAEALSYAANALNQYTNIANGVTTAPAYDADGNMVSYGDWTFGWNGENRLIAASNGATVVTCAYDFMGRRYQKVTGATTNTFLYDGWNLISETQVSGVSTQVSSYVWGLDLSGTLQGAGGIGGLLSASLINPATSNSTTVSYAYDANGNVTDLVGTSGESLAQYQFDPYGNTSSKTGELVDVNPFRFSTKYLDTETGLYFYGHRYNSPELGRWLSRDPIEEQGGIVLYAFVNNDTFCHYDPLGQAVETLWDVFNIGVGVVELIVAPSWVAAGAVLVDLGATAIPGLPGGAGVTVRTARLGRRAAQGVRAAEGTASTVGAAQKVVVSARGAGTAGHACRTMKIVLQKMPYDELIAAKRKLGLGDAWQAHHIIEKRLATVFQATDADTGRWMAVALDASTHQRFTSRWAAEIPTGIDYASRYTPEQILRIARERIYQDAPDILANLPTLP